VSGRRVIALFRRLTQEIRRDRPSLGILFVAPLLITGLVTFIVREGQAPKVDAVVVNQAGPSGVALTAGLDAALATNGGSATLAPDGPRRRNRSPIATPPSRSSFLRILSARRRRRSRS